MADFVRPRKRRRIRGEGKKKLLIDEKVEVRSLEDGFLGSWHTGTIVECEIGARHVRYHHLLTDEGSEYLADYVGVSSHIDGSDADVGSVSNFRGRIRPVPPVIKSEKTLQYGICVDAYHNEAWWEGVVFDQEDNSEERKIFFPDLGDELIVKTADLRICLDWNEINEEWTPRGKWLFLEILQQYEHEIFIPVSAKQIWYDVRGNGKYEQAVEWTFPVKSVWQKLIVEALAVYTRLFSDSFLGSFNFSEDVIQKIEPTPALDYNLNTESDQAMIEPVENGLSTKDPHPPCLSSMIIVPFNSRDVDEECQALSVKSYSSCSKKHRRNFDKPTIWHPAGTDIVPGAEYCPSSVSDYTCAKKAGHDVITKLRKHLLYLGFKIQYTTNGLKHRFLYTSPCGNVYYSLRDVCRDRKQLELENFSPASEYDLENLVLSPVGDTPPNPIKVDAEYCPEAVIEYLRHDSTNKKQDHRILQLQARKHLSAMGWSLWFKEKKGMLEWRYTSPEKKTYYSLRKACEGFVAGGIITNSLTISYPLEDSPHDEELLHNGNVALQQPQHYNGLMKLPNQLKVKCRKRKKLRTSCLSKPRGAHGKPRKRLVGDCSRRVLRSTKRARRMVPPNSSHHNPRTILSWLIDNNVVLPRTKVYYRSHKDHKPMAEGRITRDGIRCNCCHKAFSISNFEVHAGSSRHNPSANIFLEDGRSLVECQTQILRDSHGGISRGSLDQGRKNQQKKIYNDSICSVCHYGGKLILCDQCPSSFHASCLNLQDIPEDDWFCPSCCCAICSKSKFDGDTGQVTDTSTIFCHQCERQYHVGCLRDRGMIALDFQPKASWFCSKSCEKICHGLQKLVGKPIRLAVDDLTWTLLKAIQYENDQMDDSNIEAAAENYSKLNVALEVMHECFEPVKEPRTKRDLVEDVIFSRGSELNRLNFRGFYTVLLERNGELISVATIRIYGEKVAEVPLVGTRFQFRRLGMCRVLMNELEKVLPPPLSLSLSVFHKHAHRYTNTRTKSGHLLCHLTLASVLCISQRLYELGVERLVLPAVHSVLNTWTTAFGFLQMTQSDRSGLLAYTFLNFQDTIMCQKLLRKPLSKRPRKLKVILREPTENENRSSSNVELDGSSAISEVFQEVQIGRSESVDEGPLEVPEGNCNGASDALLPLVCEVKETTNLDPIPSNDEKVDGFNFDSYIKYYRRKKASLNIRPMPPADYSNVQVSCR
ncbi:hypothetical protein Dimus_007721 [Dionaea muscipula]